MQKRGRPGGRPRSYSITGRLHRKNLNDPHSARFDNDDLIVEHEIQIVTLGSIRIKVSGTRTRWMCLRGTTVPTFTLKSTLLTRGALRELMTVSRIWVRCCSFSETFAAPAPRSVEVAPCIGALVLPCSPWNCSLRCALVAPRWVRFC